MNILQIGSGMPGWAGTEKYLSELSQALLGRGHQVTVACPEGSALKRYCLEQGIPRIDLLMRRTLDWPQLPSFVKVMRRRRYDVVHIHGYRDYIVPALAARLTRVPAVVMTRHLPHAFRSRSRARLCSCLFYDRIIAVSYFVEGVLLKSGVPAERLTVVQNGVRPQAASDSGQSVRGELGVPADAFLVAAAGRIEPQKGFETLVRAMARVQGHCVIAGGGGRAALYELVTELGLKDRVHLPGFRRDMARLWACADVVVIPSTSADCFPYVAIEAFSAAKPVVASRIGGIPEACNDECAVLVSPGDAAELAAALGLLAASPKRRLAMGAAAKARASQFTLERMVDGIERVYCDLLNGKTCQT
ncbi:MAG: glycosyltransferase [Planctomycetaceae bacterium]|nr:glycosyltransferase [Planctomycetaceae bacterium]